MITLSVVSSRPVLFGSTHRERRRHPERGRHPERSEGSPFRWHGANFSRSLAALGVMGLFVTLLLIGFSGDLVAQTPIFTIRSIIPAPHHMVMGTQANASYRVRNTSPHRLRSNSVFFTSGAVSQTVDADPETCGVVFDLDRNASCVLKILIDTANALPGAIIKGGPTVCYSNTFPVYCSDPEEREQLDIHVDPPA